MFVPKVNERLSLGTETYYFTEHPALVGRNMPYGQTGRRATVFQLRGEDGKKRALKVFAAMYRNDENLYKTGKLLKYSDFPGLETCERFVISKNQFPSLIQENRDLDYSVLMPWIEGQTWQDVVLSKKMLSKDTCLENATELNRVLSTMEKSKVAHCDLSGPNLIIRPKGMKNSDADPISLIDLEEMYAPDLTRPNKLPAGSAGYAHCTASKGLWSPDADRFAGSILLANMLAWCDPVVVDATFGENYFAQDEMHTDCNRYQILTSSLARIWGRATAELFDAAWHSKELRDCPTFADWANEFQLDIEEIQIPAPPPEPVDRRSGWTNPNPIPTNGVGPVSGFIPLFPGQSAGSGSIPQPVSVEPSEKSKDPDSVQSRIGATRTRTGFSEITKLANWREIYDPERDGDKDESKNIAEKQSVSLSTDPDAKYFWAALAVFGLIILLASLGVFG